MALRPPGSRSNLDFLLYSALILLQLAVMIGGNLLLGYVALSWFGIGEGLAGAAAFTGLPEGALVAACLAALALDGWVVWHKRQERKKALQR